VRQTLAALVAGVVAGVLVAGGFAFAQTTSSSEPLTGCLTADGRLVNVALGSEPLGGTGTGGETTEPSAVSVASEVSVATVVSVPENGTAPALTVTAGDGSLTATWEPVNGSVWHQWRYRQLGTRGYTRSFGKNRFTAEFNGLTNGITYEVEARAYIGGAYRAWAHVEIAPGPTGSVPPTTTTTVPPTTTTTTVPPTGDACDQVVSWAQGSHAVGGSDLPWTLYHAATFKLTNDGCVPNAYRWQVAQTWGEPLSWKPSECWIYTSPSAPNPAQVQYLESELPSDRALFMEHTYFPITASGSGAGCYRSGRHPVRVGCYLNFAGGDLATLLASEPISQPIVIWQAPTTWQQPMSPPMPQP